ncbi:MAG: type II secretion system protein [Burkholderiales bacterium]|nr:type II secretion system protein [Burkholderiales bacterium]
MINSRMPPQGGFAYLWTLMLIGFMGVSLVIGSHLYQTTMQREKEAELLFIGRQFRTAFERYKTSGPENAKDQYPATLEDLLKDPRFPNTVRHLRKFYRDPMTGKNEWAPVLINGRVVGVHSLSEQKPIKQDNFEAADASFRGKDKYSEWVFTFPPDLLVKENGKDKTGEVGTGIGTQSPNGPVPPVSGGMTGKGNTGVVPPDANEGKGK